MKQLKKYIGGAGDVLDIIGKTLGSYLGVVSNIAGTIIGIFATVLVIASIVGIMPVCEVFADVYRSQRDGIRQVSQYERR